MQEETVAPFFHFYGSLMASLANITNQCLNSKYSFSGFNILEFINLIKLCGDIEENPGPKTKPNDLSLCQWNENSIPSHSFQKIEVVHHDVTIIEVTQPEITTAIYRLN